MGVSVREHPPTSGTWYVFIQRKQYRKAVKAGTRTAANQIAARLKVKIASGDFSPESLEPQATIETFRAFTARWLKDHAPAICKTSTIRSYESYLDTHIYTAFGDRPIASLERADLKALISGLRTKGLAPKTRQNVVRCVSTILTEATEQHLLPINPAFRMGRFCADPDAVKVEINPLTRDESDRLLEEVLARNPTYYEFFLTALRTGLRLGELIELKWGDIDLAGGFIYVSRGRTSRKVSSPKSKKGRRVDMSPQLSEALSKLRTLRDAQGLLDGHVFLTMDEFRSLDADNFRHRVFYPLLEAAQMRKFRLHDLRHTYASQLLASGANVTYVKEQMGHSSIMVTVDIYGHLIPGEQRAAVAILDSRPATEKQQEAIQNVG